MNGKTIRQSLAILALGFVVVTTGCNQKAKVMTAAQIGAYNAKVAEHNARMVEYRALIAGHKTTCRSDAMMDVSSIDRALTYNEIRSQYNKATADEFVAQGLNR